MAQAEVIQLKTSRSPLGERHIFAVRGKYRGNAPFLAAKREFFGAFSKVTGIREEIETVSWRDGTDPLQVRKGIGTLAGGVVTFEKGIVSTPLDFINWFLAMRDLARAQVSRTTPADPGPQNPSRSALPPEDAIHRILIDGMDNSNNGPLVDFHLPVGDNFGVFADLTILVGSREYHPDDAAQDAAIGGSIAASMLAGNIFGVAGGVAAAAAARAQRSQRATVIRAIHLTKCWPVAYQIADLDASSAEIAIESLSVAFDSMDVQVDSTKAPWIS